MSTSKIQEGDQIIIKTAKFMKVFQARKNRVIRVEKTKFTLDDAIGAFYGSSFEAKGGKLVKIVKSTQDDNISADKDTERDNRHLTDTAENQKLKKEDIQAMRKGGASGHEIVDKLVVNSSTFKEKTEFSQEKYIKKKKKKHVSEFTILKPNTRLLAKLYFSKGPVRMCNLRYDSIAQILTQANVHSGCKLMVFESVIGLLVGAIMERLGGDGQIVQFYTGSAPARQSMEPYNFSAEVKKCLIGFPLDQVSTLSRDKCKCYQSISKSAPKKDQQSTLEPKTDQQSIPAPTTMEESMPVLEEAQQTSSNMETEDVSLNGKLPTETNLPEENNTEKKVENENAAEEAMETADGQNTDTNNGDDRGKKRKLEWDAEKEQRRLYRQAEIAQSRHLLESANMDGLIVASKWHPTPIVMGLIDFVAPSRPIVIFSQYKEPLLDCYVKLRNRGGVVSMRLSESWLRNYQVLPNRTHPEINMNSAGGYILTGTTIIMDKSSSQSERA